jgi:hypothetical protein
MAYPNSFFFFGFGVCIVMPHYFLIVIIALLPLERVAKPVCRNKANFGVSEDSQVLGHRGPPFCHSL